MKRHAVLGLLFGVGFALFSTGCQLLRDKDPIYQDKKYPNRIDNPVPAPHWSPPGTPVPADSSKGGLVPVSGTVPPAALPPVLPAPTAVPPATPVAPAPLPPAITGDPHQLPRPTATGAILNLAPGEAAMDRTVELVRRIDEAATENKILQARVRSLEAKAIEREERIAESVRDAETGTAEVAKLKGEIAALHDEIAVLKKRAKDAEKGEAETYQLVFDLLKKLLNPVPEGKK